MTEKTDVEVKLDFIAEARRLLSFFKNPEWVVTSERADDHQLTEYAHELSKARGYFTGLPESTSMNMVMGANDVVIAITGSSEESAERAKAIVGFLLVMPDILDDMTESIEKDEASKARITELIQHNNAQLFENRAQREVIRQLKIKIDWLLEQIPGVQQDAA